MYNLEKKGVAIVNFENIKNLLEDISLRLVEVKEESVLVKMLITIDDLAIELDKIADIDNTDHCDIFNQLEELRDLINEELGYLYVDTDEDDVLLDYDDDYNLYED
jgi:hypothetical protein